MQAWHIGRLQATDLPKVDAALREKLLSAALSHISLDLRHSFLTRTLCLYGITFWELWPNARWQVHCRKRSLT